MNSKEMMDNFAKVLLEEQGKRKYTNQQMASALGVSESTYRNIVARRVDKVSPLTIKKAHDLTGLYFFEMCGISTDDEKLFRKFMELPEGYRNYIIGKIDFYRNVTAKKPYGTNAIPVIVPVGNCEDGMYWISSGEDVVNIDSPKKYYCGVQVTSNHLHPTFVQGDILLIEKKPVRDGDVGIFIRTVDGEQIAYCRQYKQGTASRFVPVAPYGEEFVVDIDSDEWIKFGVVASVYRKGNIMNVKKST